MNKEDLEEIRERYRELPYASPSPEDVKTLLMDVKAMLDEVERLRVKLQDEHDCLVDTDHALSQRDAEVERLRKRTHEIQESADKRYSDLLQETVKPLEYWRSALALADKYMTDPGVVFHSAVTRAKAADLFMQIERLRTALSDIADAAQNEGVAGEGIANMVHWALNPPKPS